MWPCRTWRCSRRELELVAARLPDRRRFAQLHLGGGTPTYYSPAQLTELLTHLRQHFHPLPGAELAVEVDPRVTTREHLDALADLGFNRVSLGVQDLTPEVQEAINRIQSLEQTAALIEHARRRGFRGINVDLIYGLPLQTPESFERTVDSIVDLGVDRAAVYSFAFVPWVRGHQKHLEPKPVADPSDVKVELFAIARERFLSAGYEPIGMDHFARPDDDLARARRGARLRRNFQGYAVIPGDDVLGFGISGIGDVRGAYVQNEKKLSVYAERINAGALPVARGVARTPDDDLRRTVIHELMCNFRVDRRAIEAQYGITFATYFEPRPQRCWPIMSAKAWSGSPPVASRRRPRASSSSATWRCASTATSESNTRRSRGRSSAVRCDHARAWSLWAAASRGWRPPGRRAGWRRRRSSISWCWSGMTTWAARRAPSGRMAGWSRPDQPAFWAAHRS